MTSSWPPSWTRPTRSATTERRAALAAIALAWDARPAESVLRQYLISVGVWRRSLSPGMPARLARLLPDAERGGCGDDRDCGQLRHTDRDRRCGGTPEGGRLHR